MRTLKTSLAILQFLAPAAAFAQEPVVLEEDPSATPAPATAAPATAPPSSAPSTTAPSAAPSTPAAAPPATATVSASASTATPPAATAEAAAPAGAVAAARPAAARTIGGPEAEGGAWTMTYSGYFRAPFRMGMGNDPTKGSLTLHAPVLPDDQYASWQFSPHNKREWAEMFFSMGNGTVSGTLAVQGFQFADSTWANANANFGIGQGWLELNSDLGFENIKFNAKVGSHWNRYGRAGVYDAGEYDTYLFGRTHTTGGSARIDVDMDGMVLGFEGGFGGNRPNPEMFNRARFTTLAHGHVFLNLGDIEFTANALHAWSAQEVVPFYPNTLPGSNCGYDGTPFGQPDSRGTQCTPDLASFYDTTTGIDAANSVFGPNYPNGSQTVLGIDGRFDLGLAGYLYAGFSHQILSNALTVGNAIESIHSLGAGNFTLGVVDNYLESPFCAAPSAPTNISAASLANAATFGPNGSCSNGDGSVSTIMAQYELGLSNFDVFDGDQDLRFKLYGMLNFVSLGNAAREQAYLAPLLAAAPAGTTAEDLSADGVTKLKFGIDSEFFALDWLSAGLRFDRLQPNSKVPEQNFMILSPRVSFRSQMVTRETISIQYSRYLYDTRECTNSAADDPFREGSTAFYDGGQVDPAVAFNRAFCVQPPAAPSPPDGFGSTSGNQPVGMRGAPTLTPDVNVIKIDASMWW